MLTKLLKSERKWVLRALKDDVILTKTDQNRKNVFKNERKFVHMLLFKVVLLPHISFFNHSPSAEKETCNPENAAFSRFLGASTLKALDPRLFYEAATSYLRVSKLFKEEGDGSN